MIIQVHTQKPFPGLPPLSTNVPLNIQDILPCILLFLTPFNLAKVILLRDDRSFHGFCSGGRSARFRCRLGSVVSTVTFGILFVILTWRCHRIFLVGRLFRLLLVTCFFRSGWFGGSGLALFRSRWSYANLMSLVVSPIFD